MKKLMMICVLGLCFGLGACAHKHGEGCKDGTCKMEKKACGCGHGHDHKHEAKDESKADDKAEPTKK